MSLLMDALKKAEKNRPGAAASRDDSADELARALAESPIEVPPAPVRSASRGPTRTPAANYSERDPLSLVLADDSPSQGVPGPDAAPAEVAPPALARRRANPEVAALRVRGEQVAAANVFSAKATGVPLRGMNAGTRQSPRNPKTPFYAAMGVLTLAALGVVGYFYWQLTGGGGSRGGSLAGSGAAQTAGTTAGVSGTVAPTAAVTEPPAAARVEPAAAIGQAGTGAQADSPVPAPAAAIPAPAAVAPPPASGGSTVPLAAAGSASIAKAPLAASPARLPVLLAGPGAPPAATASSTKAAGAASAQPASLAPPTQIKITRTANLPVVHAGVSSGYDALRAGKLDDAERGYRSALEADRTNRDAQLGLAAVLQRSARHAEAERVYARMVELDPADADAQAGLLALRQTRNPADQVRDESRLRSLIARDQPGSASNPAATSGGSQLALGNQLASQGRWPEAQQAYFAAHAIDPTNADVLYNLAVSLDQLGQRRLAADFYEKAAVAAQSRGGQFDVSRARARATQLVAPPVSSAPASGVLQTPAAQ